MMMRREQVTKGIPPQPPRECLLNETQRLLKKSLNSLHPGDMYINLCDVLCLHAVILDSGVGRILEAGSTTDYENPTL